MQTLPLLSCHHAWLAVGEESGSKAMVTQYDLPIHPCCVLALFWALGLQL